MIDRIVEELQTLKVDSELRERAATVLVKRLVGERDEARSSLASAVVERDEARAFLFAANERALAYARRVDEANADAAALRKVCAELHARNGAMVEALALVVLR